jgi:hypothetical protein
MWYSLLDIDSNNALYIFIGFQKRIVAEMWQQFVDVIFVFFLLGTISMNR